MDSELSQRLERASRELMVYLELAQRDFAASLKQGGDLVRQIRASLAAELRRDGTAETGPPWEMCKMCGCYGERGTRCGCSPFSARAPKEATPTQVEMEAGPACRCGERIVFWCGTCNRDHFYDAAAGVSISVAEGDVPPRIRLEPFLRP